MTPLSEIKCLVYDYGNYISIAERLGRLDGFQKVYYYTPKIFNGFPDHRPLDIGRNIPNVEVVQEWASIIDEVDLVCYDDNTEVLTKNGWKLFIEVDKEKDLIATLNPTTHNLEYQPITDTIAYHYKGDIIVHETLRVNFAVTPNHNLYVQRQRRKEYELIKAEDIFGKSNIAYKKDCNWEGATIEYITIPEHKRSYSSRKQYQLGESNGRYKDGKSIRPNRRKGIGDGFYTISQTDIFPEKRYDAKLFLKFWGFFTAEGYVDSRNKNCPSSLFIGQNYDRSFYEIEDVVKKLGFNYTVRTRKKQGIITVHDAQLAMFFSQFGKKDYRYIPEMVKCLSKELLQCFWDYYIMGDGTKSGNSCSTISKKLSNDLQEIALKLGYCTKEKVMPEREFKAPNGKIYIGRKHYRLTINRKYHTPLIKERNKWRKVSYDGFVYCVNVPNHIIYVRRNNVAIWCGNCFPDSHEPALQTYFESIGKKVFGSKYGCEIEHNRGMAKQMMKEIGLPVNDYEEATGMTELENILKQKENVFVKSSLRGDLETFHHENYMLSKAELLRMRNHMGAYAEKEKYIVETPIDSVGEIGIDTFCIEGQYPAEVLTGIELKDTGYYGQIVPYHTLPRQLKNVTDKFSPIFSDLKYRGAYSNEVIISPDKQGYLIDTTARCFSSDTEILTDKGWKFFYELDGTETVCTLNPNDRNIEYQKPTNYISNFYEGNMILFTNGDNSINSLVTPNHAVWRTDRHRGKLFEQRADSLTDKGYIPRIGKWEVPDVEYFEIPEYHHEWDFIGGNKKQNRSHFVCTKVKHENSINIKMDYWIAFLAWFLTEGCVSGDKNSKGIKENIKISQKKYVKELMDVLDNCGFKYKYNSGIGFQINSVQLSQYLQPFGKKEERYVPDYIKKLSSRQIRIFLDNYMLADGSIDRGKYFTISKKMADDLQELIMKSGSVANIKLRNNIGTKVTIKGKEYTRKFNIYVIQEYLNRSDYWFETKSRKDRYIKDDPYKGLVYDVTVPNHIVYVRRKGKPLFSGNCPQPPTDLMMEMISNYPEVIWQVANGIVPMIQYTYKHGIQLIIKSDLAKTEPSPLIIPDEYKRFVKVKNLVIDDDGVYWYTPMNIEMSEIASVVGLGSSIYDALDMAKKIAESIKGFDIKINTDCIEDAMEQIRNLKKIGINYLS